jgi:hypothetical protein
MTSETHQRWVRLVAVMCTALVVPGDLLPQQAPPAKPPAPAESKPAASGTATPPPADKPPKTPDQLDTLVAPIALYPDPLLAQLLAASTYPLEIVEAHRWLQMNTNLKGENLTKAAQKQTWDPSIQALVAFPSVLKLLDDNLQWTTELGNAFLDQQSGVMDAVQRMRKKAKDGGKLESSKEQKVEVETVESKTIIKIVPSDPQVIYVPTYSPTVVYPPPVYPYPAYYPYYPPASAYVATAAISFGVGVAMGAFWSGCCGGGGWGWGCGWSNNNITINNNFNTRYGYNNINNIQGGNRTNIGNGNSNWQHRPEHRQSVPYSNRQTAQRFGGSTRDAAGGLERFDRSGQRRETPSQLDRGSLDRGSRGGNRDIGNRDVGSNRGAQAGDRNLGGGQDRIGNRNIDRVDRGSSERSAFGGGESRARTQTNSDRGFSSARSSGSFGGGGGGGRSFSGGARAGGGRRR